MPNYWTLNIDDFVKIRKARIEVAPLTLFVGDNNSGKSHLLSLLWGLTGGVLPAHLDSSPESYVNTRSILDEWSKRETSDDFPVESNEHEAFVEDFNSLLMDRKDRFLRKLFNREDIDCRSIGVDIPFQNDCMVRMASKGFNFFCDLVRNDRCSHLPIIDKRESTFLGPYSRTFIGDHSTFLPKSRAGLFLAFGTFIRELPPSAVVQRIKETNDHLTRPQLSFLELCAHVVSSDDSKSYRVKHLIEEIICGEFIDSEDPFELFYRPYGTGKALSLYRSSGATAEMVGLIFFLKKNVDSSICIFEEPELQLHPEMQWKMARILVKLANAGISVWASTHSDTIIQHINNMIKLSNNPNGEELRKEHEYDRDDVISPDNVRMYQFDVAADRKTDVTKLECGINGFRVPTFGKVIRKMRDEVWTFQIEQE